MNTENDILCELDEDTFSKLKGYMKEDGYDDVNEFLLLILKQYLNKRNKDGDEKQIL